MQVLFVVVVVIFIVVSQTNKREGNFFFNYNFITLSHFIGIEVALYVQRGRIKY